METTAGNPVAGGGLHVAACLMLELDSGGIASITANYLNPRGTGIWGYESLRILGESGMVESIRGGKHTRLVIGDEDHGELKTDAPGIDYLDAYLATILGKGDMPITLEEELSPTRWAIRAKGKQLNFAAPWDKAQKENYEPKTKVPAEKSDEEHPV